MLGRHHCTSNGRHVDRLQVARVGMTMVGSTPKAPKSYALKLTPRAASCASCYGKNEIFPDPEAEGVKSKGLGIEDILQVRV